MHKSLGAYLLFGWIVGTVYGNILGYGITVFPLGACIVFVASISWVGCDVLRLILLRKQRVQNMSIQFNEDLAEMGREYCRTVAVFRTHEKALKNDA